MRRMESRDLQGPRASDVLVTRFTLDESAYAAEKKVKGCGLNLFGLFVLLILSGMVAEGWRREEATADSYTAKRCVQTRFGDCEERP